MQNEKVRDEQLWKFSPDEKKLKNKKFGDWMYEGTEKWIQFPDENCSGVIQDSSTSHFLGLCDVFSAKEWKRGVENSQGYFMLQEVEDGRFLAAHNDTETKIEGT